MMLLMLTARGSKMPWLSLPVCILRWIFPPLVSPNALLMGNSCSESNRPVILSSLMNNLLLVYIYIYIYIYLYNHLSFL